MATLDLTGQRFGKLVAEFKGAPSRHGSTWQCRCDCGGTVVALASNLRKGNSQSCGCSRRFKTVGRNLQHGHGVRGQHSPEYRTWRGMLARCRDPEYPGYGAEGIRVCARWERGEEGQHPFECFLHDMGARPSRYHSIDRLDGTGDYHPSNCRWATAKEQARNRRTSKVREFFGTRMTVAQAAESFSLNYDTLQYRLDVMHMAPNLAVTRP